MKYHLILPVILALSSPLSAQLRATFHTTEGDIFVDLQYQSAPRAVANFITLAQGSRARLDPTTGSLTQTPLYIGERFFRVISNASFKIAQTGSGTGTNSGGPGFTFKDEFDPTLLHEPYVLSMANSGPNTNGSQIFFTGDVSTPSLDFVHTVFGRVTDPTSQSVIDSILASGDDGTTINDLSFERLDQNAIDFDEHDQNLPVLSQPKGKLSVTPGDATTWQLEQALTTGAILSAFSSSTLEADSWTPLASATHHIGITSPDSPPTVSSVVLDSATDTRQFYKITLAQHPESFTPSTLANRSVIIDSNGNEVHYQFDDTGESGNGSVNPDSNEPLNFSFTIIDSDSGGHHVSFIAENIDLTPQFLQIQVGCDSANDSIISGRHSTQAWDGSTFRPFSTGNAEMTR